MLDTNKLFKYLYATSSIILTKYIVMSSKYIASFPFKCTSFFLKKSLKIIYSIGVASLENKPIIRLIYFIVIVYIGVMWTSWSWRWNFFNLRWLRIWWKDTMLDILKMQKNRLLRKHKKVIEKGFGRISN